MDSQHRRKGLLDIAERAGVSLSTVDRVLNERGSVSDAKRRKVLEVARDMGLRRLLPSAVHGLLRFDLLMVNSPTTHYQRLDHAFMQQAQMLRSRLVLQRHLWDERYPAQLLELIDNPRARRHGLIVVAHDTPAIRDALQRQIDQDVPVILITTSLSDLAGATYIGIDNLQAGRSAGRLLCQWLPRTDAHVLLVTNSLLYHAHRQRVQGFVDVLRERAPQVRISGPVECFDDDAHTAAVVSKVLGDDPQLAGIYTTGSGLGAVPRVLLQRDARPAWVGHEVNRLHARLLREGLLSLVLDQDPEGQAEAAIQHLLYRHGDLDTSPLVQPTLKIVIDETLDNHAVSF